MHGTDQPPPPWVRGMRHEVRRLVREAAGARRLPHQAWAGRPGGDPERDALRMPLLDGEPVPMLRLVLIRALEGLPDPSEPVFWVARPGDLEPDRVDRAWWSAAHEACRASGQRVGAFCLVGRRGWRDLESDLGRTWARIRV